MLLPERVYGELIPALSLPDVVTAYRARVLAADAGEPVTTAQFEAFRRAGLLLPPRADGAYDGRAVNQLVAAKRAGRAVRPLARRVVFLRADHLLFPVPARALREALVEMSSTVEGAARKLSRVRAEASLAGAVPPLPRVGDWAAMLTEAPEILVDAWAPGWYAMARDVVPASRAPDPSPIDDIPLEEQVLCLAVLGLARRGVERRALRR